MAGTERSEVTAGFPCVHVVLISSPCPCALLGEVEAPERGEQGVVLTERGGRPAALASVETVLPRRWGP